jgi:hypothetical protein
MKSVSKLIIRTIIFNFLILMGYGHGIGFLGFFELFGIVPFIKGDVKFSLLGNYNNRLFTSATFSLIAQIILLIAYYKKAVLQKYKFIYAGILMLFFSYFILTIHLFNSDIDIFSFCAGIPFFIIGIILLIKTIKQHRFMLRANKVENVE